MRKLLNSKHLTATVWMLSLLLIAITAGGMEAEAIGSGQFIIQAAAALGGFLFVAGREGVK